MSDDHKIRILIVDDEQAIRDEFKKVLGQAGTGKSEFEQLDAKLFGGPDIETGQNNYDLTLCSQGPDAVAAVKDAIDAGQPFAAAFLDVRMPPGPDGVWTAQEIRKLDPDVNIVIVTAYSDIDPAQIGKLVTPADKLLYVQKPFYPQEIRQFAAALSAKWIAERDLVLRNRQLEQLNRELDKAYSDLVEADKLKTDFIVNVSHELRTPLTIFKNVIENAMAGVFGKINDKFTDNLKMADQGVNRIAGIISNFAELTEIELGKTRFVPKPVLLQEIVSQVVEKCTQAANDININISAQIDPEALIWADQNWMSKAISSVIDNALKFSQQNSSIEITATQNAARINIEITDHGCGIEPQNIEKIFDRFVKVNNTCGAGTQGVGLGLTTARAIIERHRGTICASSMPGKGTTVFINLPESHVPAGEQLAAAGA